MYLKKNLIGWELCIVLSLAPLFFWVVAEPFAIRYFSTQNTMSSFGEITGLVGTMLFSLDFILALRLKFLEQYFGGLNKLYLAHHIFGGVAFILLLLHPIFLAGVYLQDSIQSAAAFLLPGGDWAINLGIASLFLMMALLIVTFFVSLPYDLWKLSHKFLGVAFFLGAVHGFFVSSDIQRFPPLFDYMLVFVVLGSIAYIYQIFLRKLFLRPAVYVVTRVATMADNVIEIDLQNEKRPLTYKSGQFIFISFKDTHISTEMHPFSISSSPNDGNLAIVVKAEGDYTKELQHLSGGAKAYVEGPFGTFDYEACNNNEQVWIGGGIGIVPFLSMAKTLAEHQSMHVDLYYVMHDEKEGVYTTDLQALAEKHPNFSFAPYVSAKKGRLTATTIADASGDIVRKDIFLCGPPLMMHSLVGQFKKLGVAKSRIHSEEFAWE